jgi:lactate dehydrogenase-like 2-hydroxyacid dehydrogenase
MPKPTVLQLGPYPDWDQGPLDDAFQMLRLHEAADRDVLLAEHGDRVRAIAARGTHQVGRDLLDRCPNCEIVVVYGVGYDGVDLEACRARGIAVTNTPDVLTEDVADFGVAMMLAQQRGIVPGETYVRRGDWAARGPGPLRQRVHGQAAGILGLGRIGAAVARRLQGFGMDIAYSDLAEQDCDWTFITDPVALALHSDVLFVTLSASAATRGIVSAQVLEALGPDGLLVNISRASNVDEPALIAALESGALGAAALDFFDGEPKLDPRFLDLPNVLLEPHAASATVAMRRDMGALMRENLMAHFNGQPLVTPVP